MKDLKIVLKLLNKFKKEIDVFGGEFNLKEFHEWLKDKYSDV